jgi:hypothetical protein
MQELVPWWSNIVSILVTAVVAVLATKYAVQPSLPGVPSVPTVGSFFKDTITYIPHILLLFGVLADMFTYQGVYSIPSLIGLISIPLNFVFKYFWIGMFDTVGKVGDILTTQPSTPATQVAGAVGDLFKDYDGCTVQGFKWAASPYAPQTLVITATVFFYYIFDLIVNRGFLNATAAIVGFVVLFGAELMIVGDCDVDGQAINKFLRGAMALIEGVIFGGTGYAVVQAYYPSFLPSSAIYPFPKVNARDLSKNASGQLVDSSGRPYIQLPNGQAIPDLQNQQGQAAWSPTLSPGGVGTGTMASPGGCSK